MSVKKFGARDINLTSSSGTPNITSPNILEINAQSVAISTDLSIGGDITSDIQVVGVATFQDDVVLTSGNLNVTGGALFTGDVQSTSTGFSFLAGIGTNTATDDFSYLSDGEIVVNRLSNSTAFQASSSGTLGATIDSDGEANFSINNPGGVVNVGPYQNSNNTFGGVSLFSVGAVKANRPSGQQGSNVWLGALNGDITSRIYAGGDAHFNGNVGIATNIVNSSEALKVQGDAIVTGIVSASSFIADDFSLNGDQFIDGNLNVTGIITTSSLYINGVPFGGSDGSNLTSLEASKSALSEYASHSQTSNSAHSLSGISTQVLIASFTGSNSLVSGDEFGYDVATSADGKTVVASSKFSDANGTNRGAVYVFDREGSNYIEVAILTGSDGLNDHFGESVATSADGKTIIVGAPQDEQAGAQSSSGLVYVYNRVGNNFNQVGILTGVFADGSGDNFGQSVAISADGKTIVVGARYDESGAATDTGLVYIYDRNEEDFNQVGIITGSRFSTIDQAGFKVDLSADGKVIAFGSPSDEGLNMEASSGIVYVYDRNDNNFNEVGILTGSYANSNDGFGSALSMSADGKTIAVGAFSDELPTSPAAAGLVYVFDRVGNDFNEVGAFSGSVSTDSSDYFGWDVSLSADGNTLLVGAYIDEAPGAPAGSGAAYLFNRQGNTFNEISVFESPIFATGSDAFGYSVELSADGKTAYVGAIRDEISATDNGVVHAYDIVEETYVNLDTEGNAIFNSTGSIQIPVGTTAERLGIAVTGQIRYNTDLSSFEGYGPGGAWGSLGGVKDVDQDTFIISESTAGADEDTLFFHTSGSERLRITSNGNVGIGTDDPISTLDVVGPANSEYMRVGGSSHPLRFSCSAQGSADNANHDIDVDSSAGSLSFSIGTFEKMRLDSSGRVLVGLTSQTDSNSITIQGNSGDNAGPAYVTCRRGASIPLTGQGLGYFRFENSDGDLGAQIRAEVEGNWSTVNDEYPTALCFHTRDLSDSSTVERMRIINNGDSYFTNKLAVNTTTIDATAALNVAGHIYPSVDATHDLGAPTRRWNNIYTTDLKLSNEGSQNDVDGTWGNYTIQEGEEELYLINHRNGKKYKFMLQEVN